ncbi:hypothetical protein KTG15_06720 [Methanobacterium sp. YSL]|nr:hypothetical protein [Methanobacterium sp. YSL]
MFQDRFLISNVPEYQWKKVFIPPKNNITLIVEGHPPTASPKRRVLNIIIIMNITAKIEKKIPVIVDTYNGTVENDMIPSMA